MRPRPLAAFLAALAALVLAAAATMPAAGAAPRQEAPPPSLPPGLPVVEPPADPAAAPVEVPPMPDPSPQVTRLLIQLQLLDLQNVLARAQAELDHAQAAQQQAEHVAELARQDRDRKHEALTDAAASAYVRGGVDEVGDQTVDGQPADAVATESARVLAVRAIDNAHDRWLEAEQRLRAALRLVDEARQRTATALANRDAVQAMIDQANASLASIRPGKDLSPTVLGDPVLSADEIVGWYRAQGVGGWNATVDLPTIVGYYLDEGKAEGVRSDVAFAQSMVETGAFTSPLTGHNNFAGIGACDTCATGYDFASAQLGVRAQMQLLHAYADRSLGLRDLAHPAIGSNPDRLSVRGCCTTWNKLTGTWASDPNYGPKIMTIYLSMLQYAYEQRTTAPRPPVTPSP